MLGEYYACKSISVYIIVVQLKLNFYHIIKCNFPTRNSLVIRIYGNLNRYRQAEGHTERQREGELERERECGGLASVSVPSVLLISLLKEMCSALWLLLHLDHKVASAQGRLEKSGWGGELPCG